MKSSDTCLGITNGKSIVTMLSLLDLRQMLNTKVKQVRACLNAMQNSKNPHLTVVQ